MCLELVHIFTPAGLAQFRWLAQVVRRLSDSLHWSRILATAAYWNSFIIQLFALYNVAIIITSCRVRAWQSLYQ